jgi:two-component SAPR family response regulator
MDEDALQPGTLAGRTVLLLEDDYLVGLGLRTLLDQLGANVVGPIPSIEAACRSISDQHLDGAVLDINIRGFSSEPVAVALRDRDIPFCFVTGFLSPMLLSQEMKLRPRLNKPVAAEQLETTLHGLMP